MEMKRVLLVEGVVLLGGDVRRGFDLLKLLVRGAEGLVVEAEEAEEEAAILLEVIEVEVLNWVGL